MAIKQSPSQPSTLGRDNKQKFRTEELASFPIQLLAKLMKAQVLLLCYFFEFFYVEIPVFQDSLFKKKFTSTPTHPPSHTHTHTPFSCGTKFSLTPYSYTTYLKTNPSVSSVAYGYFFFVIYKDRIKTVQFLLALQWAIKIASDNYQLMKL